MNLAKAKVGDFVFYWVLPEEYFRFVVPAYFKDLYVLHQTKL